NFLATGDAIIVTNQDHEANSGAWRRLKDAGIIVKEWRLNALTGQLDIADLERLLDRNVKLVCFPHCSNVVGQVNPVSQIVSLIHANGSFACVDGVSYAPHGLPNLAELGADIYLFSSYKTYGPHQGIMVVREALARQLPNQGHFFNSDYLNKRFTPAGPDHAQIAACAGMADYIDALYEAHFRTDAAPVKRAAAVHDLMRAHEQSLLQPVLDLLRAKNAVRLLGSDKAENRAPTVAIDLGVSARPMAKALAARGIMVGDGDFYANRALRAMGVDPDQGVLRLSFVHYTNQAEIDKLLNALDDLL
ncbi:MAG: aminotransferase class V-fold PLP-dependent enzyme, partial [Rhodobacteraceae bacterium]|nr:aminotransferase class V-fold PLP-dependent enzyme [Paracoccaceae bacterium]